MLPAYDQGRKEGKTAAQLLSPDSKDYLGASIASFKRPMSQWTQDMVGQNGGQMPATVDLSTPAAVVAAYKAGKVSRAEAEAAATKLGYTPDVAAAAHVPVNE